MKPLPRRARQHGIAAIELALILSLSLFLLPYILLFGRVFWHYTALQKAAHDAARYMSTLPQQEMGNVASAAAAATLARTMVSDAALGAGLTERPETALITVNCITATNVVLTCGGVNLPAMVQVTFEVNIRDDVWNMFTAVYTGQDGIPLTLTATLRYVP
ncbi:MAG: TadE/TadG family type IV pilus assembly protein [Pseudomonadota bacterium]